MIGESMAWDEAVNLVRILRADPASMLCAAMEGWEYPVSREAFALYDVFDLLHAVNSKTPPRPHPARPGQPEFDAPRQKGNAAGRSPEEMKAILRTHFGQPEAPV